ncbi:MAG: hypothetical protein U1E65_09135 [Myxococcota bacterium]
MVVKRAEPKVSFAVELVPGLPPDMGVSKGHRPKHTTLDGFNRASTSSLSSAGATQGPAILEGLRTALEQLLDPAIAMNASQLGGRLRALTKGMDAALAEGSTAVQAAWLGAAAVTAAEARTAAFPKHTMALKHAFDAAWGAASRLEAFARNSTAEATVEALMKHARAGGTEPVAQLIAAADTLRQVSGSIANERSASEAVSSATLRRVEDVVASVEPLLKLAPAEPLSRVDLAGLKSALEIVDRGTHELYRSAHLALVRQKDTLRPAIPKDSEFIEFFPYQFQPRDSAIAALIERASKHAIHTEVNGERMVIYPSDRLADDPVGTVLARYQESFEKTYKLQPPNTPDDRIHTLRAQLANLSDALAVPREVLEAAERAPRSLAQLQQALGTSSVEHSGMEKLRHPVEIERWTEFVLDHFVEYVKDAIPPDQLREKALAEVKAWLSQPYLERAYGATLVMWQAARAKFEAEWSPKLS